MVCTRLQVTVKGCLIQVFPVPDRPDGVYFCVRTPELVVIALPDNPVTVHQYTSNQGIRSGHPKALPRQFETAPHIDFVLLRQQGVSLLLLLVMLQNHATLQDVRRFLRQELTTIYPGREADSMIALIMSHSGFPPVLCLTEPNHRPGSSTVAQIKEIVDELHTHKPLQYILGYTVFCDLKIRVNENVLIPRPETEEMVYRITRDQSMTPAKVIDVGTGSGNIALALKSHFRDARVTGLEVSSAALEMARLNGRENGLEVNWVSASILEPDSFPREGPYDMVVSNPPYVLQSEKEQMAQNVSGFEPHTALFVPDAHPLKYYSAVSDFCRNHLSHNGKLWLEINERLGTETAKLLAENGFKGITIHRDIHDKERFIEASK